MKDKVSKGLVILMGVILVWGIVVASFSLANNNRKIYVASATNSTYKYNKDGKEMVRTDVDEEDEYYQVKFLGYENISSFENQKRIVKNKKIIMNKAKELMNENKDSDSAETYEAIYNAAVADHKVAVNNKNYTARTNFTSSASAFFSPYFTIVIFLGIALLINQKIDYKESSKAKETKDE